MKVFFMILTDHQGNIRVVANQNGELEQMNHYYPFGGLMGESTNSDTQPYKYNGKELDRHSGLDWYDYGARWYNGISWMTPDPLAEKYYDVSPYVYCANNPMRYIDPTGMFIGDFIDEYGKYLGNDGINDSKVYVIKTTKNNFDSGVSSAGISKQDAKMTIDFIRKNSGNTESFQADNIAYNNSVEIVGDLKNRQAMINIVNQDNGKGGTAESNNREYGGIIRNGLVMESPKGTVSNPKTSINAEINHPDVRTGDVVFHSHPSGSIVERAGTNTIGGTTTTYLWHQAPSITDINGAIGNEYVFSRRDGNVYIYNRNGVVATIPQKRFVNFKK